MFTGAASSSPPNHGSRLGSATGLNQEKMVFDSLAVPGGYKRSADETVSLTLLVHFCLWFDYNCRLALSAAVASCMANSKKSSDWPRKSRSSVKTLTVATAPPNWVEVGRITEQGGRSVRMKSHGSGWILLVWVSSSCRWRRANVAGSFRSGNVSPLGFSGSVKPAKDPDTALPALSCHSEKWSISTPPILSKIRKTSSLVALSASVG